MRRVAHHRRQLAAKKHRRDDGHVGGVILTGLVRVIEHVGIAGRHAVFELTQYLLGLRRDTADMQRLRHPLGHHAPVSVKDRKGEVLALLDHRRVAGAQHVERQLLGNLYGRPVDDFHLYRIHSYNRSGSNRSTATLRSNRSNRFSCDGRSSSYAGNSYPRPFRWEREG